MNSEKSNNSQGLSDPTVSPGIGPAPETGSLGSSLNPNQPVIPSSLSPEPSSPTLNPEDPNKKSKKHLDGLRSIISTFLLLLLAPLIAFSITAFALQSYQVDGQSMETTLQNQDRLIVDKISRTWSKITKHPYIPNRGDIIIFNQANLPGSYLGEEKQLIKRVIGLPGDRVVIKDGRIKVYNQENPNGFDPDTTVGYKITANLTPGEIDTTLGENEIFVSGDNRTNSEDSRYFGPIKADAIVGKLILRLLPISNAERF